MWYLNIYHDGLLLSKIQFPMSIKISTIKAIKIDLNIILEISLSKTHLKLKVHSIIEKFRKVQKFLGGTCLIRP